MSDLLDWIYTDGQRSAVQEGYSASAATARSREEKSQSLAIAVAQI
jgi:hypothetical protein